jgi:hypothetical protein
VRAWDAGSVTEVIEDMEGCSALGLVQSGLIYRNFTSLFSRTYRDLLLVFNVAPRDHIPGVDG